MWSPYTWLTIGVESWLPRKTLTLCGKTSTFKNSVTHSVNHNKRIYEK
jgi:hypothetical protein